MGRTVSAGSIVRGQMDLYSAGITRQAGVLAAAVTAAVFYNNLPVSWPVADGTSVLDSSVSAGSVYFHEISGVSGYYSVRFFPDRVGFWRICLKHAGLGVESVLEFDVVPAAQPAAGGLNASFG
jgi:hypothetical protein